MVLGFGGKVLMLEAGVYDDYNVDISLMTHPAQADVCLWDRKIWMSLLIHCRLPISSRTRLIPILSSTTAYRPTLPLLPGRESMRKTP